MNIVQYNCNNICMDVIFNWFATMYITFEHRKSFILTHPNSFQNALWLLSGTQVHVCRTLVMILSHIKHSEIVCITSRANLGASNALSGKEDIFIRRNNSIWIQHTNLSQLFVSNFCMLHDQGTLVRTKFTPKLL